MTQIIAKPTSLTIGDKAIFFEEKVRYASGFYDVSTAREDFFFRYAHNLAKQRGITNANNIYTSGTPPNRFSYFLEQKRIDLSTITPEFLAHSPKINEEDIVGTIPPFVKYLSITLPNARIDLDKKLIDLETKLNSFGQEGILEAIYLSLIPRARPSALKLALTEGCTVNIIY